MPTPSHVERAQDAILGALAHFYTPQLVHIVQAAGLTPESFTHEHQRAVYRAVLALHGDGSNIDGLVLEGFLARHGWLERVGGRAFLDLLHVSAQVSCVREHTMLVVEEAKFRRWMVACEAAQEALYARDSARFWDAVHSIREDVEPEQPAEPEQPVLRVVEDEAA